MDNSENTYREKVWEWLDTIEPCKYFAIENICIPENKNQFIACVKSYMDTKKPFQGYISFNHDYSKVYKIYEIEIRNNPGGN